MIIDQNVSSVIFARITEIVSRTTAIRFVSQSGLVIVTDLLVMLVWTMVNRSVSHVPTIHFSS